jgi:hypothetical protein
MSENDFGSEPSAHSDGYAISMEPRRLESARRGVAQDNAADAGLLAQIDRDQLARDFAEIERASATLRKAEPALESWTNLPAAIRKPRPVWLIIGVLWLSSALLTVGALAALAALVG